MNNIGLPIKYAVEPIYSVKETDLTEEKEYDIDFYLATMCWISADVTKYMPDGTSKRFYEVVYPFEKAEDIVMNSKHRPVCDRYGTPHHYLRTNDIVYDTIEEALIERDKSNAEHLENILGSFSFSTEDELRKKYLLEKEKLFRKVELYQDLVLRHTETDLEEYSNQNKEKVLKK